MRKIIYSWFFCIMVMGASGQFTTIAKSQNEALARLDSLRRPIDSALNPRPLNGLLAKKFPGSPDLRLPTTGISYCLKYPMAGM